ncbi:hypothetical protein C5E45_33315 [Nocardia nova]|uniref:Uncharacterized protein n=1 Tax=Nocardia nova TaxID=37330 RepID=A0A2S6ACH3_9NOCA|nr:hypothetical protein [Nocardia nova]PPJ19632.1 hypothetical protein C5E41_31040 [Nocardia nova]PPJ31491.1 hypothetical protein C5E45_33315 [Nocardia nova]
MTDTASARYRKLVWKYTGMGLNSFAPDLASARRRLPVASNLFPNSTFRVEERLFAPNRRHPA